MRLDPGQIEVVDPQVAMALRKMTCAQRLAIANGLFVFARDMLSSHLRTEHPDWDDAQVQAETAHRLSHGAV
ncbi:MAG: hypothetical protein ACE5GE_15765 [Phycisphaerae bacterium]